MSTREAHIVHLHNREARHSPPPDNARQLLLDRRHTFHTALARLCRLAPQIDAAAAAMIDCLRSGGRVLIAGNGGSAAAAQHFATELVGRFLRERTPYDVLALTADTAILTAVANDYGYDQVFARQVGAYGRSGDMLVALSTSGESRNLLCAAASARERGLTVLAITGGRANSLTRAADIAILAPARDTPLIQELHMIVLHVVCDLVERALATPRELVAES